MKEAAGVYGIYCVKSAQYYVGATKNISKRWSRHRHDLKLGCHRNKRLQAAWDKFGAKVFHFFVFEFTDDLMAREQFFINQNNAATMGFNECPQAGSSLGRKWTATERRARGRRPYNTSHLNTRRAVAARVATTRKNGHPNNILTWNKAQEIRRLYAAKAATQTALAIKFGVSPVTVHDIIKGKTWRTNPNEAVSS